MSEPPKGILLADIISIMINESKIDILFDDTSITKFIISSIPQLRNTNEKNTDAIIRDTDATILDTMLLNGGRIHDISDLLSEFTTTIPPEVAALPPFSFEQFINTHLPNYFQLGAENKAIFYPSGDNPNHNFNAQIIGTHLLPTRDNIKSLLTMYFLCINSTDSLAFVLMCINNFNRFFLNYYDPTDHTRELLVEARLEKDTPSQVILAKYVTPQVFHDAINGDTYVNFIRTKGIDINHTFHRLGLFQIEYVKNPETGAQNINFSIVKDEIANYLLSRESDVKAIKIRDILQWYVRDEVFRKFLNKVFEKHYLILVCI